eukprot:1367672-Pyramimonas_sp.AAC.1
MVLFALATDPITRWVVWRSGRFVHRMLACADDWLFMLSNVLSGLPPLLQLITLLEGAAGLMLNFKKCVILLVGDAKVVWLQRVCKDLGEPFSLLCIVKHCKYLGILIGPEAAQYAWDEVIPAFVGRYRAVRQQ